MLLYVPPPNHELNIVISGSSFVPAAVSTANASVTRTHVPHVDIMSVSDIYISVSPQKLK